MTEVVEATPLSLSAVLLNGLPTVIFPSRPYRRVIRSISMFNPEPGRVTIYRGTVGAFKRVSSHPQGSDQEYTVPFNLPSGASVYVQWDATPSPVSNARAVMTWMEDQ